MIEMPDVQIARAALAREGFSLSEFCAPRGQRSAASGFRIFRSSPAPDFFSGGHLTHCRTIGEIFAFLDGFKAGRAGLFGK